MLEDPKTFTALLRYLTVQVSDFFRDPSYFRAIRERIVPYLETYPSLGRSGCQDARPARKPIPWPFSWPRRVVGAHAHLRDRHQLGVVADRGGRDLRRRAGFALQRELSGGWRKRARCPTTIRPATPPTCAARPPSQEVDPLLRPQPGDRQHVRRVQLVSCRNVLIYFDRELCKNARSGLFCANRSAATVFWGSAAWSRLEFSLHGPAFRELVPEERLYQVAVKRWRRTESGSDRDGRLERGAGGAIDAAPRLAERAARSRWRSSFTCHRRGPATLG